MDITLSKEAKAALKEHFEYLDTIRKADNEKLSDEHKVNANKKLENDLIDIISSLGDNSADHPDSIFPDKYTFGESNFKMLVTKDSHFVAFYKVKKSKSGKVVARIVQTMHQSVLEKDLKDKNIKPLKDADPKLLKTYKSVERDVHNGIKKLTSEEEEEYNKELDKLTKIIAKESEEIANGQDENPGERTERRRIVDPKDKDKPKDKQRKIKVLVHIGPNGGEYFMRNGKQIYLSQVDNTVKKESKLISLSDYITENTSFISLVDYMKQFFA